MNKVPTADKRHDSLFQAETQDYVGVDCSASCRPAGHGPTFVWCCLWSGALSLFLGHCECKPSLAARTRLHRQGAAAHVQVLECTDATDGEIRDLSQSTKIVLRNGDGVTLVTREEEGDVETAESARGLW